MIKNIRREDILKAMAEIDTNGVQKGRQSTSYDVVYNEKSYPPKLLASIASSYINGKELPASGFYGGEGTELFRLLRSYGFDIRKKERPLTKNELTLDVTKYTECLERYLARCTNSDWLTVEEHYKFQFGNWMEKHLDLSKQTDEELLNICLESQKQIYSPNSKVKGMNFILSELKFRDQFITLDAVKKLRALPTLNDLTSSHFKDLDMTFPKVSIWASMFKPEEYIVYATVNIMPAITHLFSLQASDVPKNGFDSFKFLQIALSLLSEELRAKGADFSRLLSPITNRDNLSHIDWAWITQDFCFYVYQEILKNPRTIWVFQRGDDELALIEALKAGNLNKWVLSGESEKIRSGDKIILWIKGENPGCYGLGEILSENNSKDKNTAEISVELKIEHNLWSNPIFRATLVNVEAFKTEFESANSLTHFSVSEQLYSEIVRHAIPRSCAESDQLMNIPLNRIFYGPPGTGKTYRTVIEALRIVEPQVHYGQGVEERKKAVVRFNELKKRGQISFVTFHQNYGYEEFVEGIRPDIDVDDKSNDEKSTSIKYIYHKGIFRTICSLAEPVEAKVTRSYDYDLNSIAIWKMSLGDTNDSDQDYIFNQCIQNDQILLGYGSDIDYEDCKTRDQIKSKLSKKMPDIKDTSYSLSALDMFINRMKLNDLVIVSYGNSKIRAIGRIAGAYQYLKDMEYHHMRSVEWIKVFDTPMSREKILTKAICQMTLYKFGKSVIRHEVLKDLLSTDVKHKPKRENFVLIIDEINRGNISKIFGELITLIEEDKRIGKENEIRVELPYSRDEFGVPGNLYIIGTMNTADRSIAIMDTALRRRFKFFEVKPDEHLVEDRHGVALKNAFRTLNSKIGILLGKDFQIGHSYFMPHRLSTLLDLKTIWFKEILPLLNEYFYDEPGKIRSLVAPFVKIAEKPFANGEYDYLEAQIDFFDLDDMTEEEFVESMNQLGE